MGVEHAHAILETFTPNDHEFVQQIHSEIADDKAIALIRFRFGVMPVALVSGLERDRMERGAAAGGIA
jgi:hypothetical protein